MSRPSRRGDSAARTDRLAVGIGVRPGVAADAVRVLLGRVAVESGLDLGDAVFATIASRADEPGLAEALRAMLDVRSDGRVSGGTAPDGASPDGAGRDRVVTWPPRELAEEPVPNPSGRVGAAVGTPSVAEAAALRTARTMPGATGAELVVPKTVGDGATVAVARPVVDGPT